MKCKSQLILFLIVFSFAVIPLARAATLTPYPDNEIRFSAYGTYLMWTGTITFDTLTVNVTHATFANIHMGLGDVLGNFVLSQQNTNWTLIQLVQGNITIFNVTGLGNSTTTLTMPTPPNRVYLDGTLLTMNTSQHGYIWDMATSTLTLWDVLAGAYTNGQWMLDGTLGSTPAGPSALASILPFFYLAITLIGLVPIVLAIVAFLKWQLDPKMAIGIIFSTIIVIMAVLVILTFISAIA